MIKVNQIDYAINKYFPELNNKDYYVFDFHITTHLGGFPPNLYIKLNKSGKETFSGIKTITLNIDLDKEDIRVLYELGCEEPNV